MTNLYLVETNDDLVDMDELAEVSESDIDDADKEPDSEILSTDEDELEEVEDTNSE